MRKQEPWPLLQIMLFHAFSNSFQLTVMSDREDYTVVSDLWLQRTQIIGSYRQVIADDFDNLVYNFWFKSFT